jgi:hypothetical protein
MLDAFCHWLQATQLSQLISSHFWIIPALQTVHILAIAAVVSSAFMIDLRLIGLVRGEQSTDAFAARFLPFIWWSLPILAVTGALLISAEPARSLENPSFGIKMALLLAAITVTLLYQRLGARLGWLPRFGMGLASLLLWTGIVLAGRWIAYTQP